MLTDVNERLRNEFEHRDYENIWGLFDEFVKPFFSGHLFRLHLVL